jgi:hypothetical protein
MADNPARKLFDSLDAYSRLNGLIANGEAEHQHLECKSPSSPHLNPGLRAQIGEAVSGFANSGGGVILWGMSTVRHAASGLDVLNQIEPIGQVRRFAQQVELAIPSQALPVVEGVQQRVLRETTRDTKGVLVTYIPSTEGDPIQSLHDRMFYLRAGDEFVKMPYEVLKRMFAGAAGPVLHPVFDVRLVQEREGEWQIPIVLVNESSAVARDTQVSLTIENPDACESVRATGGFRDLSNVNPGETVFGVTAEEPIYRNLSVVVGYLHVRMRTIKRRKRALNLRINIFSDRMRARTWSMTVQLARKGFSVRLSEERFLY